MTLLGEWQKCQNKRFVAIPEHFTVCLVRYLYVETVGRLYTISDSDITDNHCTCVTVSEVTSILNKVTDSWVQTFKMFYQVDGVESEAGGGDRGNGGGWREGCNN